MNKVSLFIALSVLIAPAAFANKTATDATVQNKSEIRIITRPEIMGLWGMKLPNNNTCVEYYNFKGSNELVVNSGEEWSTGIYEYQPAPDNSMSKLPIMAMQIQYENNAVDCSGVQENQAGELSQFYIKWDDANTIQFCGTEKGGQCVVTLRRVLP